MIELVLPRPTPSLNRQFGQHWSKRAKLKKQWAWMVRAERLKITYADWIIAGEWIKADGPRKVTIDRWGPRLCDHDNIVGGAKQLIDALVSEGFLVDDSPAHMVATYRQHVGKPYRTEVRIE